MKVPVRALPAAAVALALRAALPVAPATAAEPAAGDDFWTQREKDYRESPRGPFTAVLAEYLDRGASIVLIAGEDTVRAETDAPEKAHASVPAVRIALEDDGFTVAAIPGWAPASLGGEDVRGERTLGEGAGDEEDLRLGRWLLSLDLQAEDVGRILAYDPRRLDRFHGFPVFDESDAYRVVARVVPADGETVELGTTRGLVKPFVRAVILEFEIGGTPCRLTGYRSPGEEDGALFVPFRDATSGGASYGVGRYLTVEPRPDGTAPIDFNHATNPWCAYSPFYNCVLPPEENVLPVAVRAGERAPEGH